MSMYEHLVSLVRRGVEVRILHGGLPSGPFRERLSARSTSEKQPELRRCPRVHLKMIAVDGAHLYLGSANFTGAGLGAKAEGRRNFEMGLLTDDDVMLDTALARFDSIWRGKECASCKLRRECPRPLDLGPRPEKKPAPEKKRRPLPRLKAV
jgi:phosphatidylserine/phosphatidylglycerophosphate/cardiolipin synthase-like enzyme